MHTRPGAAAGPRPQLSAWCVKRTHAQVDMNPSEALLSLAEISIAFLGFAAIASVFQSQSTTGWRADGRFWGMLLLGLGTLFFSLLPLPLLTALTDPEGAWRLSSLLFFVTSVGLVVYFGRWQVREDVPYIPWLFRFWLVSLLAFAAMCLANAVGWPFEPTFWPYLAGVAWWQFFAAANFVRLLWIWLPRE